MLHIKNNQSDEMKKGHFYVLALIILKVILEE